MSVVAGITDGSSQAGNLNSAETFEGNPNLKRGLDNQVAQTLFEFSDMSLNDFKQAQVVLQEFAADGHQFRVW